MALLDVARNVIVIRVVYDGPPLAGKTTSVRALAGSLGREVYSPAESAEGRTLFFDWMDYTGGRYEGYQIRCQIVSVPGQEELIERRERLVREADVVVYVADSTEAGLPASLAGLVELREFVATVPGPPVGVIMQANKRDRADAVPIEEVRACLDETGWSMGIVESIAAESSGVRETFVFAVRLALDRVRELLRTETLRSGSPEFEQGTDLLAHMQRMEQVAVPRPVVPTQASQLLLQVIEENQATTSVHAPTTRPLPPDPSAPSGSIWPPVEGRLVLHEASAMPLTCHGLDSGDWVAGLGNGWRVHSAAESVYADVDQGRTALIQWARLHASCASLLSPRRCVVLADAGGRTWRLWQVVRVERSLREYLGELDRCSAEEVATRLLEVAAVLLEMESHAIRQTHSLPCSLDSVGRTERGPIYIGLMPTQAAPAGVSGSRGADLVRTELEPVLYNSLYDRRREILPAIERSRRHGSAWRSPDVVAESSGALLDAAARSFDV